MGVFDDVNVTADCPYCGRLMDGFQTKDGVPSCGTVDPGGEIQDFYQICPQCGKWIEFHVEPPEHPVYLLGDTGRKFKVQSGKMVEVALKRAAGE